MKFFMMALTVLFLSSSALADDVIVKQDIDYVDQLCDRVKQCRLGQLVAAEMPPFMQDFIVQTVNSQCTTIASSYKTEILEADLEEQAKSCVHSMEEQSCDDMLASDGQASTDECNDFLVEAEAAGIDFSKIAF